MAILTAVNFLGVKMLAATNSAMTWWKVAIPLLTILVLALFNFHGSNFTAANGFNPNGVHGILLAVATSGIIFSYLGFEQADQLAGEAKNPKKDIPFAIIGSIVIGMIVYILLQVAFLVALPARRDRQDLGRDRQGSLHHLHRARSPRSPRCSASAGWPSIIYVDAIVSPAGTGLIYVTGSSRVSYGLSRNGYVPTPFEWTNKRGVPWVGLIAAFITGCICFLPFPSWQSLVGLITSAERADVRRRAAVPRCVPPAAAQRGSALRAAGRRGAGPARRSAISGLIILWSGLGHRLEARHRDPDRLRHPGRRAGSSTSTTSPPHLNWQGAAWLPVYLVGMGIIVYISSFGPMDRPGRCGDYLGIVVTAIFSLAIYYWAMAVALPHRGDRGDGQRGRPARGGGPGAASRLRAEPLVSGESR